MIQPASYIVHISTQDQTMHASLEHACFHIYSLTYMLPPYFKNKVVLDNAQVKHWEYKL